MSAWDCGDINELFLVPLYHPVSSLWRVKCVQWCCITIYISYLFIDRRSWKASKTPLFSDSAPQNPRIMYGGISTKVALFSSSQYTSIYPFLHISILIRYSCLRITTYGSGHTRMSMYFFRVDILGITEAFTPFLHCIVKFERTIYLLLLTLTYYLPPYYLPWHLSNIQWMKRLLYILLWYTRVDIPSSFHQFPKPVPLASMSAYAYKSSLVHSGATNPIHKECKEHTVRNSIHLIHTGSSFIHPYGSKLYQRPVSSRVTSIPLRSTYIQ